MAARSTRALGPAWLAAIAALVAVVWLLPGLGQHGLWSDAELPALDRVRAALGAALSDLEHRPWLPELLRTRSYALWESEAGLRLPHALACAGLTAMATGLARARGASVALSLLAGAFVLAFPMIAVEGRTVLGNPIGEVVAAGAVLSGVAALGHERRPLQAIWGALTAGLLALSVASSGLAEGGVLPLGVLALAAALGPRPRTRVAAALGLLALSALVVTVVLSLRQGDGYIPLLGAAKDLTLIDKPENRRFAAGVEDLGYALYPWAPVVIAGALLSQRDRLPALWLALGVTIAGGFSLVYGGPRPLPVTIPAALSAVAFVEWTLAPGTARGGRRAALAVVVLAMLVIRKDAERTPSRVAVPIQSFEGEHTFPSEELRAPERLKSIGGLALLGVLAIGLFAPTGASRGNWLDRGLDRIPARPRALVPVGLLAASALWGGHGLAHGIVPEVCDLLSPRLVLEHHRALAEAGALPMELGNHRVRDEGLALYGPGDVAVVASRRELDTYLSDAQPRAAIIRDRDLPALYQDHRQKGWPLYVLDDRHAYLRLVANRLPEGEVDRNAIPTVVLDEPPVLAHPTLVRFETYIEIIGWQITEPIVRGREVELQVAIKVLRPLPGGSKLYARLLMDRTSRLNTEPHELTGGIYPPNLWREGDYILHRFTFEAPLLEIQPGPHELIFGLRRSEQANFEISIPEGKEGEHGVLVRDKKHSFARVGEVEVW